jgi:hypothetical protein
VGDEDVKGKVISGADELSKYSGVGVVGRIRPFPEL